MALLFLCRRPEGNPLDLNNLPDEYSRDGKQVLEDHTSSPGKLDRTYTITHTHTKISKEHVFCFYFPNSISQSLTVGRRISLFTGNKIEHCCDLLPTTWVYSLTMKQCSSNFFFFFHSWFLSLYASLFFFLLFFFKLKGSIMQSGKVDRRRKQNKG